MSIDVASSKRERESSAYGTAYLDSLTRREEMFSKKFKDSKTKAVCKYCGKKKLHWSDTQWGWLLFDKNGKRHNCR